MNDFQANNPIYQDRKLQTSLDRYGADNPIISNIKCHPLADVFPDELVVRQKSVTIVRNSLMSKTYESMAVVDIGRVQLNEGVFFASLKCIGLNPAHELVMGGLRKQEAKEVEKIIEELMLQSKYNKRQLQGFGNSSYISDTRKFVAT